MRIDTARLTPLTDAELDAEQEAVMAPFRQAGRVIAISRTLVRHPVALRAFRVWATHVLSASTLSPRDREILILRTAWRSRSGYEWAQHVLIGRGAGVTEKEMEALKRPIEEGGWNPRDAALVATADALLEDFYVPDDIWAELTAHFDEKQCMDAIFAVGQYTMVAMFLNSAGVQLDDGVPLDPDLDARA
jgi:4-carboxymuconolactone decarboxylase